MENGNEYRSMEKEKERKRLIRDRKPKRFQGYYLMSSTKLHVETN